MDSAGLERRMKNKSTERVHTYAKACNYICKWENLDYCVFHPDVDRDQSQNLIGSNFDQDPSSDIFEKSQPVVIV